MFKNNLFEVCGSIHALFINQFTSGILYFFRSPRTGLFSVKIQKKFQLIIDRLYKFVPGTSTLIIFFNKSGQPNKRLIH